MEIEYLQSLYGESEAPHQMQHDTVKNEGYDDIREVMDGAECEGDEVDEESDATIWNYRKY